MKKKNYKKIVYPWDINGYVKLYFNSKQDLIYFLLNKYKTTSNINKSLNLSRHWFRNFKNSDKINTKHLKKIASVVGVNIVKNVMQFNDDKGSSSIAYLGKFPIKYSPFWHFLFCLSIGDGMFKKGIKKQFVWYQKPQGQKKLIELLNKHGFDYRSLPKKTKQGMVIPQIVRKLGYFAAHLEENMPIKENIIEATHNLGKKYELALLCAFFMDEAGMSKPNSESTLRQEGNLELLGKIGKLLDRFGVNWSKNKKGDKWVIRFSSEGVVRLGVLFKSLKKYDIDLLHREKIFREKVRIAEKTLYRIPLKKESGLVRKYLLDNYKNKIITINEIKTQFKSNFNVSSRVGKLIDTMKKKKELNFVSIGKYMIGGEQL